MPHPTPFLPMYFQSSLCITLFLLAFPIAVPAQADTGVMNFFAARQYDDYEGEARIALVRELEKDGWYIVDSIYEWGEGGTTLFHANKRDLSPFVNNQGEVVYWVSDVAPRFPGGKKAMQQYMLDVLGAVVAEQDMEVQNSVYVRCTIGIDGTISEVAEAQPHPPWVPVEIITQCVDAVRYMPAWSPGVFRSKPVRVCVLVEVALKE